MTINIDELTIGELKQLQQMAGGAPTKGNPKRERAVLVIDRGWIYAGDRSLTPDGNHYRLDRCVHVFKWASIGFEGVLQDPSKADLRPATPKEVPVDAVIFHCPVDDQWGL